MTKKEVKEEFKKIDYELFDNRPDDSLPYPPDVVKRRELLLLAEVHLSNILGAKIEKDKRREKFDEAMYRTIMSHYYNWDLFSHIHPTTEPSWIKAAPTSRLYGYIPPRRLSSRNGSITEEL